VLEEGGKVGVAGTTSAVVYHRLFDGMQQHQHHQYQQQQTSPRCIPQPRCMPQAGNLHSCLIS
jgi:hypothetical protein